MRHYSDYFHIYEKYSPNMTREEINQAPERWLDFYPHPEFEELCKTLLSVLSTGAKSVWITGNLGTGKTNASLVLQKMFMDDEGRVRHWFELNGNDAFSDRESLEKTLFDRRAEGTLVVYDYDASNVGANSGLLVRLEKGIIAALNERGMTVPPMSNLEILIDRVRREGSNFFKTRDSIQDQLTYLSDNITTADQLAAALKQDTIASKLLSEVETVLHKDYIYLDFDVPMFRKWVRAILEANRFHSIVYLFDEFHPFIEANSSQLKTFEDVTEAPGVNRFFLIPVTHMKIEQYWAEGSENAKKANDRFYFRKLQMPTDTAFRLAKHAMIENPDPDTAAEWENVKGKLWDSVSYVVGQFNAADDPDRQRFYDILPIHPMAAFLLKHLSESAKSNQRSLFEYLKGGADGTEFQDFIHQGGPEIASKQFLTVDYLWHYFMDRSDLGVDREITNISLLYQQIKERSFQNQTENAPELRVLKAALLFCLMDRLTPGGHVRLRPTVENVVLSFRGDGTITDPQGIVESLQSKHCFSVSNGQISLFSMSTVKPEDVEKYRSQFHELLHERTQAMLEEKTKSDRQYSSGRFDIRVSDESHTTLTNITASTREKYSAGLAKDDGSVCLWFVIARDHEEQLAIPQRTSNILNQLSDHRIIMFTFPQLSFCHSNKSLWSEYIQQHAQYVAENDKTVKRQIRNEEKHNGTLDKIEAEWFDELRRNDTLICARRMENGQLITQDISWSNFKQYITDYVRETMQYNVDHLGFRTEFFGNKALQSYAKAGITMIGVSGPIGNLVTNMKQNGLENREQFFSQNPEHPLTAIHALLQKKMSNSVGRGGQFSLRTAYIELQRAPYGLRYNALTAFVLGYCLGDVLKKNYQWTNGQLTKPLDIDTLAEIVEAVVKDDGANKLGFKEKLICRLSKEERTFIKKAPEIFGISSVVDATIPTVLSQIQSEVEKKSARVPLWVLPELIRAEHDPRADLIEKVLADICTAFTTSSKGKVEERSNAVKEAGKILEDDPEIVSTIASYIKQENFLRSFEIYIDKAAPELAKLAISVGDVSHGYCTTILQKCQETAGWLWKQADISEEITGISCEYEIIRLAKAMCGFTGFAEYKDVFAMLQKAVTVHNHLPRQMIEAVHPELTGFLAEIQAGQNRLDIKNALEYSSSTIQCLFFDRVRTEPLQILRSHFRDVALEDADWLRMLDEMAGGFQMSESAFLAAFAEKIKDFSKRSIVLAIKREWKRISGEETPAAWAIQNGIPAKYLFAGIPDSGDLLKAIEQPQTFAAGKLEELLVLLQSVTVSPIADCQKALMADVIPSRYRKFDIALVPLLDYLREKYGNQPNQWPVRLDVAEFIKGQYRGAIAPQIKEKIRGKSAEELKSRLLQLAEEHPELGLLFWEE